MLHPAPPFEVAVSIVVVAYLVLAVVARVIRRLVARKKVPVENASKYGNS